jgi:23S rRNA pseudouridine955/2504/2580 synthase
MKFNVFLNVSCVPYNLGSELRSIRKIKDLSKEISPKTVTKESVGEDSVGQRVDNYLIKRLKYVPKSHIYRLLRSGQVRVNSKRISAQYRLQNNDLVRIPPVKRHQNSTACHSNLIKSQIILFDILFHDESLLVINKPAGIAVHGGSGISFGVIEQLRSQYSDWKFLELVHRLDRETSGVLLLAKKRQVLVELHQKIRQGAIRKRYLVLVKGRWRNLKQNVRLPLNKYVTITGERRVAVVTDACQNIKGMTAHTIFTLIKSWNNFSLLEAELKTGRTHQIRVHLAHLGFPIAGDDKYGDFALNKQLAKIKCEPSLQRMFLHASRVDVEHPLSGERMEIEAPLAGDLQAFLDGLDRVSGEPPG